MLAKGRLLGVQFSRLFTRDLYGEIGRHAIRMADLLREGLKAAGYDPVIPSPTNQIFIRVSPATYNRLRAEQLGGFWANEADGSVMVRFVTSWATRPEELDRLFCILKGEHS